MGLGEEDLITRAKPLHSFSGEHVWMIDMIQMLVKLTGECINTPFHVVECFNVHTTILGWTLLDELGAVSSPLHRCSTFYTLKAKYVQVKAEFVATITCNIAVLQLKQRGNLARRTESKELEERDWESAGTSKPGHKGKSTVKCKSAGASNYGVTSNRGRKVALEQRCLTAIFLSFLSSM